MSGQSTTTRTRRKPRKTYSKGDLLWKPSKVESCKHKDAMCYRCEGCARPTCEKPCHCQEGLMARHEYMQKIKNFNRPALPARQAVAKSLEERDRIRRFLLASDRTPPGSPLPSPPAPEEEEEKDKNNNDDEKALPNSESKQGTAETTTTATPTPAKPSIEPPPLHAKKSVLDKIVYAIRRIPPGKTSSLSRQSISKYLKAEFDWDMPKRFNTTLRQGVEKGVLIQTGQRFSVNGDPIRRVITDPEEPLPITDDETQQKEGGSSVARAVIPPPPPLPSMSTQTLMGKVVHAIRQHPRCSTNGVLRDIIARYLKSEFDIDNNKQLSKILRLGVANGTLVQSGQSFAVKGDLIMRALGTHPTESLPITDDEKQPGTGKPAAKSQPQSNQDPRSSTAKMLSSSKSQPTAQSKSKTAKMSSSAQNSSKSKAQSTSKLPTKSKPQGTSKTKAAPAQTSAEYQRPLLDQIVHAIQQQPVTRLAIGNYLKSQFDFDNGAQLTIALKEGVANGTLVQTGPQSYTVRCNPTRGAAIPSSAKRPPRTNDETHEGAVAI